MYVLNQKWVKGGKMRKDKHYCPRCKKRITHIVQYKGEFVCRTCIKYVSTPILCIPKWYKRLIFDSRATTSDFEGVTDAS